MSAPVPLTMVRLGGALAVFAVLAVTLPLTHPWDERFTVWLQQAAPPLDSLASALVRLGNAEVMIPAVVMAAGLVSLRNRKSGIALLWLAAGLTIASLVVLALQHLIVQPGPPGWLQRGAFERGLHAAGPPHASLAGPRIWAKPFTTPYSFPSGHTIRATLLAGTVLRSVPWAAGMVVLSMMAALIYLGGHWLSDVLGGLCLGWAFLEVRALAGIDRGVSSNAS